MSQPLIGIDAGASWIKAGVFSPDLQLQNTITIPSRAAEGLTEYIASIREAITQLSADTVAVGLAIPAAFTKDGQIRTMVNVKGLADDTAVPNIRQQLQAGLGVNSLPMDNDAHCAALGEWSQGVGKHDLTVRLLHVTWGTGIGTSLVVSGQAQYGWEAGHLLLNWSAENVTACGCGSKHDLEGMISVPHLLQQASYQSSEELLQAAEGGNKQAQAILQTACQWLARGLANMAVIAMPDVVTIGGGLMASDWLLNQLRQAVANELDGFATVVLKPEQVQRAQLGNEAGMYGAALLAQQSR